MTTAVERMGVYGLTNGLGFSGKADEKERLLRIAARAADRGDWARLIQLAAAYGLGVGAGAYIRQKLADTIDRDSSLRW